VEKATAFPGPASEIHAPIGSSCSLRTMTDVPLSLLSYLIPGDFVKAPIPFIRKKNDDSVPSTATRAFDPPLQRPTRIPHLVVSDPPSKILANLSELLKSLTYEQIANAEASPDVTAAYHVLQRNCQRLMIVISSHKHSKESSVGEVASALVQSIHEAYEQLTGGSIAAPEYETEVNTDDRVVRTDRTYVIGDKVKILWEDKGRPVFLFHKADMLERLRPNGSGLFVTHPEQPIQMNWEGVEAILAKVRQGVITIRRRW
jgi:hypothetical protein